MTDFVASDFVAENCSSVVVSMLNEDEYGNVVSFEVTTEDSEITVVGFSDREEICVDVGVWSAGVDDLGTMVDSFVTVSVEIDFWVSKDEGICVEDFIMFEVDCSGLVEVVSRIDTSVESETRVVEYFEIVDDESEEDEGTDDSSVCFPNTVDEDFSKDVVASGCVDE